MTMFVHAAVAERIAAQIIRDSRRDLAETRIVFLESDAKPSGDKPAAAKASKTTPAEKFLSAPGDSGEAAEFKVVINGELWEALDSRQREALIAHELRHCIWKEKDADDEDSTELVPAIRKHDVEVFVEDIEDYGAWSDDLKDLARAFAQLPLFGAQPAQQLEPSANGTAAYPTLEQQQEALAAAGLS